MEVNTDRSSRYGQACLSCFKTKCKCIPRREGGACERCHRLNRPCHPANALRRRVNPKQNSSSLRIANLEGTLSQLVELLQTPSGSLGSHQQQQTIHQYQRREEEQQEQQQQQCTLPVGTTDRPSVTLIPTPPNNAYQNLVAESTERGGMMETVEQGVENDTDSTSWWTMDSTNGFQVNGIPFAGPLPTPQQSSTSSALMSPSSSSPLSESHPSASTFLETFSSRMLHHFPIIHLPAHTTAEQLRLDRPFLFRAILCVTSATDEEKRASSLELKRLFCRTAFLQPSLQQEQEQELGKHVDILQGLLVYIAWGWEHLFSHHTLSQLMAAAISMARELSFLDQDMPEITRTIRRLEPNGHLNHIVDGSREGQAGTTDIPLYLERQRAILACFVLGSAVSAYYPHVDAPRWTLPMEEGLAAIVANGNSVECPSDAALGIQVRLQLFAMKAAQIWEQGQLPDQPPPETLSPQALFYIKTLMGQLQEIRASIPPALQQHFVLLAQTYYTELRIIETIHRPASTREQLSKSSSPLPTCGPTRLSCLWQSALAIKSCTSTFLTLQPSAFLGISFVQWAQLTRCAATLHHLSAVREPGWDPAAMRSLVDLPFLLSCMADKLELAAAGGHPESGGGVFAQLARGLRAFQSASQDKGAVATPRETGRRDEAGEEERPGSNMNTSTSTTSEADLMGLANGQQAEYLMSPGMWLNQFFVDGELQSI
ncbi:hypothetical protein BDW74DRAFT_152649 [Aspergillus multicolor]|uniref:fungal specific transcription factor domain-containing protein n=1 Tax=Aspergillus multicolor TaxID=41759 RepID=UPI003CCCB607